MKNDINFPFLKKVEQMLRSLDCGRFLVKKDSNDDYSVYFKRVVVVGPIADESIAKSIAEEYNNITEKRKVAIQQEIDKAEDKIEKMCSSISENLICTIVQPNIEALKDSRPVLRFKTNKINTVIEKPGEVSE